MNSKSLFLFCLFNIWLLIANAQQKRLTQQDFKKEVIDQWWSNENKSTNRECDMRIFIIRNDVFELNCVNWTNGFLGSKCAYELRIMDNIFEIKAKHCEKSVDPGFLYGYLNNNNNLFLLITKSQLSLSSAILAEKEWMMFEKIKK